MRWLADECVAAPLESDTQQSQFAKMMGFAKCSTHPCISPIDYNGAVP
jgi:hypothetical protein